MTNENHQLYLVNSASGIWSTDLPAIQCECIYLISSQDWGPAVSLPCLHLTICHKIKVYFSSVLRVRSWRMLQLITWHFLNKIPFYFRIFMCFGHYQLTPFYMCTVQDWVALRKDGKTKMNGNTIRYHMILLSRAHGPSLAWRLSWPYLIIYHPIQLLRQMSFCVVLQPGTPLHTTTGPWPKHMGRLPIHSY